MEILSHIGVGSIRFGMSIAEVRKALGEPATPFMKSPYDSLPTDAFCNASIQVFYKQPGVCEAVEFYSPLNPTLTGQPFVGQPFCEVRDWIQQRDRNVEIDDSGLISFELGIGLYVPDMDEPEEAIVVALIVFEKGYYDAPYEIEFPDN